jgi:hypothetical protein
VCKYWNPPPPPGNLAVLISKIKYEKSENVNEEKKERKMETW